MALVPLSHLYSPQNGIIKWFWHLWSWSGCASVRGLRDHLCKKGSIQTIQFSSCWTVVVVFWVGVGFFCLVGLVCVCFFFLKLLGLPPFPPLLWGRHSCGWIQPAVAGLSHKRTFLFKQGDKNWCMDQTCSELPGTGHIQENGEYRLGNCPRFD